MSKPVISRRELLTTGGALALAAAAGCTAAPSNGAGGSGTTDVADPGTTESGDDHHGDENTHHGETSHSGGHEHEHGSLPSEPAASATVAMRTTDGGFHFDPHVVWIEQGGTVTFELESGVHTATAYAEVNGTAQRIPEDATAFDTGTMSEQGATFEHTFETVGVYDYYCVPHEGRGMLGSVVVGHPDPHDQPGLAEPGDERAESARAKIVDLNATVDEMLGHTHGGKTTESGHDEGDGHHEGTTESGHDESDGHHEGTTESGHDEGDGHHDDG